MLYRGAQPTKTGFHTLADLHVKSIINLRDDADPAEEKLSRAAGMAYFWLPQNPLNVTERDARRFLEVLASAPTPVTFTASWDAIEQGLPWLLTAWRCSIGRDKRQWPTSTLTATIGSFSRRFALTVEALALTTQPVAVAALAIYAPNP